MLGTFSASILALLLICGNAFTASGLNMTNICLLLEDNALIASGESCSTYYLCSNNVPILQSCASGTYFNKNVQSCVSTAPSYCAVDGADPCTGHAIGTYTAVPNSCSGYYYCSAKGALRSNCPNDLVFNPTTQACDYKDTYSCDDTTADTDSSSSVINLCSYVRINKYFGNAFNCAGWQICSTDNSFKTGTCKDNLVFNTKTKTCDYKSNVVCSQVTNDPNLEVTAANGGACTVSGNVKSATACNQYYYCNGANYVLKTCTGRLYFDTVSGECVNRINAVNDCDRCLGSDDTFVNAYGTDCKGYLYCSNGFRHSSALCANDEYFNELLGGCVKENPNFECCANSTSTTIAADSTTESSATTAKTESGTTAKTESGTTAKTESGTTAKTESGTTAKTD